MVKQKMCESKEKINDKAVRDIGKIIKICLREGKKRDAPIFRFEEFRNDFEALIKIILSARTRDETTIRVTKRLFKRVRDIKQLYRISEKELEKLIYGVAFYRVKARKLKELARIIIEKYDGRIPMNREELINLPGIGRKTANVFLGAYHKQKRIGVDVHVHRISNRLGIVHTKKPIDTEKELEKVIPKNYWNKINKAFVAYGQTVCKAKPLCNECKIKEYCEYYKENKQKRDK